jgi:uncharacterized protein YndB with AHSA1/START domain
LIAALALAHRGIYGLSIFVVLPVIAGALGTWSFRPRTAGGAARIGATVGCAGCLAFLLLGKEGYICMLMALPLVLPLTTAGSLFAYWSSVSRQGKQPVGMALLLPLGLLFDVNAKPPVYSVTTSIVVNASPERVWKYVVAFPDIQEKPDWVLSTGLAYPVRTRIDGSRAGAARSCDLSTGTVQERVVAWEEPRLLRFTVLSTPPAMVERGLYGPIHPKHLDGYYISKAGQFELTPLSGGRTLVVGTSWYRHGLWPAEYWRWWSDAVVHHIHRRVLEHIRMLSESS